MPTADIERVVHRELETYFVLRSVGCSPLGSSLESLTGWSGKESADERDWPPPWLLRLCQVAVYLERLTRVEREAVRERWSLVIRANDLERIGEVEDLQHRRAGEREQTKKHRDEVRQVREQADEVGKRLAYRRGVAHLCEMFAAGQRAEAGQPPQTILERLIEVLSEARCELELGCAECGAIGDHCDGSFRRCLELGGRMAR